MSSSGQPDPSRARRDLVMLGAFAVLAFLLLARVDAFERFHAWSTAHEKWQVDELFSLGVVMLFAVTVYARRRWLDLEREVRLRSAAEAEVGALREVLPICSFCKQIRTDTGAWRGLAEYVHSHPGIKLSHGICPGCESKHYSYDAD